MGSFNSNFDKEAARKLFKVVAGDRVKQTSTGLIGTVWGVRPTVVDFNTGGTHVSYTVSFDRGLSGIKAWPEAFSNADDLELFEEKVND